MNKGKKNCRIRLLISNLKIMMSELINPVAVLVASFAAYLVGWAWYSKVLFQKPWMESLGKTDADWDEKAKKEMPKVMLYGFLVTTVVAYGIAVFLAITEPKTLMDAIQVALLICFSFIVTTNFQALIYESKEPHWSRKPQQLFLISAGYQIVSFLVMTAIIWYMTPQVIGAM